MSPLNSRFSSFFSGDHEEREAVRKAIGRIKENIEGYIVQGFENSWNPDRGEVNSEAFETFLFGGIYDEIYGVRFVPVFYKIEQNRDNSYSFYQLLFTNRQAFKDSGIDVSTLEQNYIASPRAMKGGNWERYLDFEVLPLLRDPENIFVADFSDQYGDVSLEGELLCMVEARIYPDAETSYQAIRALRGLDNLKDI
jgi:hypothetical protein